MLWSSGINQKSAALIVRYSQKKKWISIVFYCSENPSIGHNLGTTGPIQVVFSAKCTSLSEHFNQKENWKCYMCEFQLIPLDCITYDCDYIMVTYIKFILYLTLVSVFQSVVHVPRSALIFLLLFILTEYSSDKTLVNMFFTKDTPFQITKMRIKVSRRHYKFAVKMSD